VKITAKRVGLAVGTAIVAYGGFALLRSGPVPVETARATRRPLQVTVDEEGETRVRDRYVVAAPVAGRVARITLREGDSVRAGTVLARMSPTPLDPRSRNEAAARLDAAEDAQRAAIAAVAQARLAHEQAHRAWERAQQLAADKWISPADREQVELEEALGARELESAEFRAQAAAHDTEVARAALAAGPELVIRAPVAARVLRVPAPSERVVAAGTPLLEIGDPSRLEIVADFLSTDAVNVARGAPLLVEGWGGKTLRGRVRLVEPSAFTKVSALGVEEQRVNVIGDFVDPPGTLGDRYRVEIRIILWQGDSVLTVPASALFRHGEGWCVFVVERGRARQRDVVVGHRTSFDAEIVNGLALGEIVIPHPSDRMADGVRVAERP
jgi:HlyD family secretion protein